MPAERFIAPRLGRLRLEATNPILVRGSVELHVGGPSRVRRFALAPSGAFLGRDATMGKSGTHGLHDLLETAGLRPTRQRLALAGLLFAGHDRHVTAEGLHDEAMAAGEPVALATVYNTLHQFTQAGLLRAVGVDGAKTYFDTNTSDHHHYVCGEDGTIFDVPGGSLRVTGLPAPPEGMEIARVDVVVRLRKVGG